MLPSAAYLLAFGLTCLVEVPLFLLGCHVLGWIGPRGQRPLQLRGAVLLGFALNLATHPVLWTVTDHLVTAGPVLLAEAVVVSVEALVVWLVVRRDPGWALLLCLGTNAASVVTGALLLG